MMTFLGIMLFVVLLLASVALHEAGHLLTAKKFGMKATEFFVGFGPKIWSFRRGETEYGLKAIPAGGYVKIVGMTELDEVDEKDAPRAFYRFSAPKKLVVLAAGSTAHMIIGFLLFAFVLGALGTPKLDAKVGTVAECIQADSPAPAGGTTGPAPAAQAPTCTAEDDPSPAVAAGLRKGDLILAVGGVPVDSWTDVTKQLRAAGPGDIELTIQRAGERMEVTPTLVERERASLTDPDKKEKVGVLGVSPDPNVTMERDGPLEAMGNSAELVGRTFALTGEVLVAVPEKIPALFEALVGGERDKEGLVGVVGVARISGEVLASDEPVPMSAKVGNILIQVAALNIFIGLFNILPLLPLDGGHMAVVSYEAGRRRLYLKFGKADPGRVDMTKLLPATYAFLMVIIGLTVLLLAADLLNPVTLNS
jgi:membrane-associated protease RseP (regulator of RpoE activity)